MFHFDLPNEILIWGEIKKKKKSASHIVLLCNNVIFYEKKTIPVENSLLTPGATCPGCWRGTGADFYSLQG